MSFAPEVIATILASVAGNAFYALPRVQEAEANVRDLSMMVRRPRNARRRFRRSCQLFVCRWSACGGSIMSRYDRSDPGLDPLRLLWTDSSPAERENCKTTFRTGEVYRSRMTAEAPIST